MDPLSISVGALGIVESLDKLIRRHNDRWNDVNDVLPELSILVQILIESKAMIDELSTRPSSLAIALKRCQELLVQLEDLLHSASNRMYAMRRAFSKIDMERLRVIVDAFKNSVLLFRDIATE